LEYQKRHEQTMYNVAVCGQITALECSGLHTNSHHPAVPGALGQTTELVSSLRYNLP
jgi:hypothetical protein